MNSSEIFLLLINFKRAKARERPKNEKQWGRSMIFDEASQFFLLLSICKNKKYNIFCKGGTLVSSSQ